MEGLQKQMQIDHLQKIQDKYVGQVLHIASSLFGKMPEARKEITNGDKKTYQKTLLLIKKQFEEINKIAKEVISVSKDW